MSDWIKELGSFLLRRTPFTSLKNTSFSAPSACATAVAAVNADWNISGSCTTPTDADNTLVAVLAVAPLGTLGVGNMDTVGGVVLGAGISS